MRQHLSRKLAHGLHVICLMAITGMFMSAVPAKALDVLEFCQPGSYASVPDISLTLYGPDTPINAGQQVTFSARATDYDYCELTHMTMPDEVNKFTWYVDGSVYTPGENQQSIHLAFSGGTHIVKVVADDAAMWGDDSPVEAQVSVSVSLDCGYTYDKNGNRATMRDARGITQYEYDVLNRLTKVTEPDGKWIAYEYDGNGNRTKMTTHSDGTPSFNHVTLYEYNDRNLLWKVTDQLDGVTEYSYKDSGQVDTIIYPNGTKAIHSYNRNWLTSISNQKSDNTIIAQFDYFYDDTYWGKNGTRTRVIENILKPDDTRIKAQVDYEYDLLYRLVHEHRIAYGGGDPGVAYEYNFAYDDAGNRTAWQVVGGTTTAYTYDAANKMLTAGGSSFDYDVKGNTLTETNGTTVTAYTWDLQNRMTQWAKTGQTTETTETYVYNADGMRVRKTPTGGTATDFMLDGREIAEAITGSNDISYVAPGVVCEISGTTRTVYHADGIGSTRAMSDCSTPVTITEAGIYDAYGNLLTSSGTTPSFGFAGQYRYYADTTGLNYLKARYYETSVGRFTAGFGIGFLIGAVGQAGANPIAPGVAGHAQAGLLFSKGGAGALWSASGTTGMEMPAWDWHSSAPGYSWGAFAGLGASFFGTTEETAEQFASLPVTLNLDGGWIYTYGGSVAFDPYTWNWQDPGTWHFAISVSPGSGVGGGLGVSVETSSIGHGTHMASWGGIWNSIVHALCRVIPRAN